MVPAQEGQKLICKVCGNEVMVLKVGSGGDLTCCNQSMQIMDETGTIESE